MGFFSELALASDAVQLALLGGGFWGLATIAGFMEWRRGKSRSVERIEQVGWVPWLAIFIMSAVIGGGMLAMSLPAVIGSL